MVERTGVRAISVAETGDFLPTAKRLLGRLLKKLPTGKVEPIPGIQVERFRDLLGKMPESRV